MRKFFIISLLTCSCFLHGQVWTNLIDSVPQQGWADFTHAVVDSNSNSLYIGGQFYHFNQFNTNAIIKYNGSTFDTLQTGLDPQDSVYTVVTDLEIFQNKLYVFGNFKKTGKYWCPYIGRWNGTSWDTVNFKPNNLITHADVYNNELYVAGYFDTIGGISSNCVAKYDGTNWHSLSHPVHGNIISALKNFNGRLYMAGQTTTASSSANLSYWDGTAWLPWVGVSGDANKGINGISVVDTLMFVYGRFNSIAGTNCKGLAAFNGTHWYGFGDGLSNSSWETIYNVQKINNKIYITGHYNSIQGISTGTIDSQTQMYTNVVTLDNQQICSISPPFGSDVYGMVGYNNNLYSYGTFRKIATDTVWGFVKYNSSNATINCSPTFSVTLSTVGIEEIHPFENTTLFPIPTKEKIYITIENVDVSSISAQVLSSSGQEIINIKNVSEKLEIDLRSFSAGLYFIKLSNGIEQKTFKVIKE